MPTDKDQDGLARQIADEVVERLGVLLARDTRPLLSVPQVAERLGISDKGAWNIVQRGELPSVMIGASRRMVEQSAVDEYIAGRRQWTATPD
jgi:excisionase family DNA binding protein